MTYIPNSKFEQALIDLGIDSDGTINGQVLTSDIDTVTVLNVRYKQIYDLTGIEDFTALEDLNIELNHIQTLDLFGNLNLKTLKSLNFFKYYPKSTIGKFGFVCCSSIGSG